MTPAEQVLWYRVRDRRLGGYKVRRQYPVDRFIADFYVPACRLIIEVDGAVHIGREDLDEARTVRLEQQGFTVLRFTNARVLHAVEDVVCELLAACRRLGPAEP